MRDVPYPELPSEEVAQRLSALHSRLGSEDVDALVLVSDENIAYYSGFRRTFPSPLDWFQALVLTADGRSVFLAPSQNVNIVERTTHVDEVRAWGGPPDLGFPSSPVDGLSQLVSELLPSRSRIGLELGPGMIWQATVPEIDGVRAGLAGHETVDASSLIWAQRAIKTPWEQATIRELGRIVAAAFQAGLETIGEGVTERQVLQRMIETSVSEGAFDTPLQGSFMIRSGQGRYDMFCARPVDRVLQRGDQLMMDSGPSLRGYVSDIQRQACIGSPSDLERSLFDRGRAGFDAALGAIRAGAPVRSIYEAATEAMAEFPGGRTHAHIRFMGHGIGLVNHEPPWLTDDSEAVLESGMTLSIEIPSYDVPDYRVIGGFLEDMVLVTDDGHENFTAAVPHDLWIVE